MNRFSADESGATAIEYALIGSCIFLAIIGGVGAIAPVLLGIFADVAAGF